MTTSSDFGIGAQVFVRNASATDLSPWPDEPSGVIVRAAGSGIGGVWGRGGVGGRSWWVEFDEPQRRAGSDDIYSGSQIHERYLELAPPIE